MGKKARAAREERRETFAAKRTRARRRNQLMAAAVLAGVASIVAYAAYSFVENAGNLPGSPPGSGPLGDEHVHASLLMMIHGDAFNFASPAYQVQNNWIHFENQDGKTIHRHASGVTLGYMFETFGMSIDDECVAFKADDGRVFCTGEEYELKYFVNRERVESLSDYVIHDGDYILITYGGENEATIDNQLDRLAAQEILA